MKPSEQPGPKAVADAIHAIWVTWVFVLALALLGGVHPMDRVCEAVGAMTFGAVLFAALTVMEQRP